MIGWVYYKNRTTIHPVLCWGTDFPPDGSGAVSLVVTTTGLMWVSSRAVPLDTEVEVAALLLQGYTMAKNIPMGWMDPIIWLRRNHR